MYNKDFDFYLFTGVNYNLYQPPGGLILKWAAMMNLSWWVTYCALFGRCNMYLM
jgi:hypothetical protein